MVVWRCTPLARLATSPPSVVAKYTAGTRRAELVGLDRASAVSRFLGQELPHRFLEPEKKPGLLRRLFGGRAA